MLDPWASTTKILALPICASYHSLVTEPHKSSAMGTTRAAKKEASEFALSEALRLRNQAYIFSSRKF
jgi:hypothetical protein